MGEKEIFQAINKICPKCQSKTIFRDTIATFCGDCGYVVEETSFVDAMIDEHLKLEIGNIYSAEELEEMIRKDFTDFFFFANALLSSKRLKPYFKILPKN